MIVQTEIDVRTNRRERKYRRRVLLARLLWRFIGPLYRFSPRPFWGWRRLLLRMFGATIGPGAHVYPTVKITMPWNLEVGEMAAVGDGAILYALGPISIGPRATVSQYAHLCAGSHDISRLDRKLLTPPIVIGPDVWVAADAFIGPGVSVGAGSIVGARSVAMKDIEPFSVVAGNPAKVLRRIDV